MPSREQRDKYLQKKYGIILEEWEELWEWQGKRCLICHSQPKRPVVDHNHRLGNTREAVRGLICKLCNRAIAHVREDALYAHRLARYLEDPPAQWKTAPLYRPKTKKGR